MFANRNNIHEMKLWQIGIGIYLWHKYQQIDLWRIYSRTICELLANRELFAEHWHRGVSVSSSETGVGTFYETFNMRALSGLSFWVNFSAAFFSWQSKKKFILHPLLTKCLLLLLPGTFYRFLVVEVKAILAKGEAEGKLLVGHCQCLAECQTLVQCGLHLFIPRSHPWSRPCLLPFSFQLKVDAGAQSVQFKPQSYIHFSEAVSPTKDIIQGHGYDSVWLSQQNDVTIQTF